MLKECDNLYINTCDPSGKPQIQRLMMYTIAISYCRVSSGHAKYWCIWLHKTRQNATTYLLLIYAGMHTYTKYTVCILHTSSNTISWIANKCD